MGGKKAEKKAYRGILQVILKCEYLEFHAIIMMQQHA